MRVEDTNTKTGKVTEYIQRNSVYIVGVILGLVLIVVNAYVGLSLVRLLLDEQDQPEFQGGLSLPVINTEAYKDAKQVYLDRQQQNLGSKTFVDPFRL